MRSVLGDFGRGRLACWARDVEIQHVAWCHHHRCPTSLDPWRQLANSLGRSFTLLRPPGASATPQRRRRTQQRFLCVRGGGRGYQNGGPLFANLSPRLSLFSDHLRTVLAVKGSLRRAPQRRALDGSGPFRTTLPRRGKGSLRTAPLAGDHFAAILVPSFFAATDILCGCGDTIGLDEVERVRTSGTSTDVRTSPATPKKQLARPWRVRYRVCGPNAVGPRP